MGLSKISFVILILLYGRFILANDVAEMRSSLSQNRSLDIISACHEKYEVNNQGFLSRLNRSQRGIFEIILQDKNGCSSENVNTQIISQNNTDKLFTDVQNLNDEFQNKLLLEVQIINVVERLQDPMSMRKNPKNIMKNSRYMNKILKTN